MLHATASTSSPTTTPFTPLDRARYRTRHHAMAIGLGFYIGLLHRMVRHLDRPDPADFEEVRARFEALLEADLANVEAGYYPRSLLFQVSYGELLKILPQVLLDQPKIVRRARKRRYDDLPADVDIASYPHYYQRTFHWQTDGWLSRRSARLYDLSDEMLFGGTAHIMRRMALPAVVTAVRERQQAEAQSRPRVLDVACGTGRFLDTMRRCMPDAGYFGVDLSKYYIEHAREQLQGAPAVHFSVQNAESLSFESGYFDAISMVFLLHELPSNIRRWVVREAARVLAPGGRLVICDALQSREAGRLGTLLKHFPALYHEPYFKGYLQDELETVIVDAGLTVESSQAHYMSKVVVARH